MPLHGIQGEVERSAISGLERPVAIRRSISSSRSLRGSTSACDPEIGWLLPPTVAAARTSATKSGARCRTGQDPTWSVFFEKGAAIPLWCGQVQRVLQAGRADLVRPANW